MVHVIATSIVKEGCRAEFLKLLMDNVPLVLAEEGCRTYLPCLDLVGGPREADPNAVTIIEEWESLEHLKAHFEAPHMKTFAAAAQKLRVSSTVRIVEPVQ